jgi:hypothetical protein
LKNRKTGVQKGNPVSTITLQDEWIERVVDIVQGELEVTELDLEQREALERVVMLSISMYMMCAREAEHRTSRLTQ